MTKVMREFGIGSCLLSTLRLAQDKTLKLVGEGLRYKPKKSGLPFAAHSSINLLSCYKFGKHKPRGKGSFKSLLLLRLFDQ